MELNFRLYTRITWIVCLFACMSCSEQHPKLERLHQISPDSVIAHYDLSGDSLKEFPDLSGYTIRSLDLSHNLLDTFVPRYLPTGLEKLDLSYNRLEGKIRDTQAGRSDVGGTGRVAQLVFLSPCYF